MNFLECAKPTYESDLWENLDNEHSDRTDKARKFSIAYEYV